MKIQLKILSFLVAGIILNPLVGQTKQCTDRLEVELNNQPTWMLEYYPEQADDVPLSCIKESMEVFYRWTNNVRINREKKGQQSIGHYGYCESGTSEATLSHQRPCPTDNYLNLVSNSFNSTLKCLGFKPKDLFAITAVESGFQINTLSIAGIDIGIGQLTPVAVEDVNPHWDEYVAKVMESDNPHCEGIKSFVKTIQPSQGELTCDLISLPENPIKNLLYLSFLHFKNREYMNTLFDESSILSSVQELVGRKLKTDEKNNLREILVTLSYNAGSIGAIEALSAYIASRTEVLEPYINEIETLSTLAIDLYLAAQQFSSIGHDLEAVNALEQREVVLDKKESLIEEIQNFRIPLDEFAINGLVNSFGEFLVESNTSRYLDNLKSWISHIENRVGAKGQCAPDKYLETIKE